MASSLHRNVNPNTGSTIDIQDTLFFDLSAAVFGSGYVEFPVYFVSDDTINAVDFAMRFNQVNLQYDTVIGLSTGLNASFFLNPADSTFRFTSYDLNPIPNHTQVAFVRFYTSLTTVSSSYFFNIESYLNGFPCTYYFIESTNSINEQVAVARTVFPNPAAGYLVIPADGGLNAKVFTSSGEFIQDIYCASNYSRYMLQTAGYHEGNYIIKGVSGVIPVEIKFMVVH